MKYKKAMIATGLACSALLAPAAGEATELVWNFINPSFVGGNPYNASWLLAEANAQNSTSKKSSSTSAYTRDPMEEFRASLNSQILYRLSRKIIDDAFGEGAMGDGTYKVEGYEITVLNDMDGVNVTILNPETGEQTTITVPHY